MKIQELLNGLIYNLTTKFFTFLAFQIRIKKKICQFNRKNLTLFYIVLKILLVLQAKNSGEVAQLVRASDS